MPATAASFAALGDPTRFAIVAQLGAEGPQPSIGLKANAAASRQAISKHLRILESVGLIRSERRGRHRVWTLEDARLAEMCIYLSEISAQWDKALARLRALVETDE